MGAAAGGRPGGLAAARVARLRAVSLGRACRGVGPALVTKLITTMTATRAITTPRVNRTAQRDPADGEHRDRDCAANFSETLESLRSAECRLRWRGEDRAKKKIVCATARGGSRSFQRVTGNTNQEILALGSSVQKPLGIRQWQTVLAQMHAAGALREGDV